MELETFFTVPEQTRLLLYAVLLGIPLGMGFDVLRTLRRRFPLATVLLAGVAVEGESAPLAAAPRKACHSPGGCVVSAGLGGGTALFFHGSGTGRVPGLLLDGQRPGLSAVPLYPGMRHRAAAAPDLFGSGQVFPAAFPAAVPRCCADLHPVEPEIWTFRQTFSKSIFFFAFTLAER